MAGASNPLLGSPLNMSLEIEESLLLKRKKKLKRDQCTIILVIFSLLLAIGPNFAWLFFSKYL